MVTIKIRPGQEGRILAIIKRIEGNAKGATLKSMRSFAFETKRRAQGIIRNEKRYQNEITPGRLERDITIDKLNNGYDVSFNAPYADAVDTGAQPHTIVPVNARMLRWERNGQVFYRKIVHHPGIQVPMEFASRGVKRASGKFNRDVIVNLNNMFKEAVR